MRKFLRNLLRSLKMPASFDFLKIRLLAYFDRLTWTLLSKSLILWLSLLPSSVTRLVYNTRRICTDQFQFNFYLISKSSFFYPLSQRPNSISQFLNKN